MAISNHQEIVVNYLCADPNIFVSEEYYVAWDGGGKDREIWVDAVAMEISRQIAYLVEVTAGERASAIIKKLNGIYSPARLGTVRRAMLAGRGLPAGWDLRPWLFVKAAAAPRILANLPDGATPRITYLDERVAWAWERPTPSSSHTLTSPPRRRICAVQQFSHDSAMRPGSPRRRQIPRSSLKTCPTRPRSGCGDRRERDGNFGDSVLISHGELSTLSPNFPSLRHDQGPVSDS